MPIPRRAKLIGLLGLTPFLVGGALFEDISILLWERCVPRRLSTHWLTAFTESLTELRDVGYIGADPQEPYRGPERSIEELIMIREHGFRKPIYGVPELMLGMNPFHLPAGWASSRLGEDDARRVWAWHTLGAFPEDRLAERVAELEAQYALPELRELGQARILEAWDSGVVRSQELGWLPHSALEGLPLTVEWSTRMEGGACKLKIEEMEDGWAVAALRPGLAETHHADICGLYVRLMVDPEASDYPYAELPILRFPLPGCAQRGGCD